ncbi:MAG: hypothetical protein HC901_03255 [Bdellovibrionaceae bacterium]|nr:hypothetical protein [Pseudobdellovibrionaceae bacterium]
MGGDYGAVRAVCLAAFEAGVAHLDLSNLHGSAGGMAESLAGRLLREEFAAHRDDWIIATRAGGRMWAGAYGSGGSRKHLRSSLDQSLRRLGLDYVDIFYYEQGDKEVPWEEPLGLLADAVRAGKALYAGIAGYAPEEIKQAAKFMKEAGVPLAAHACGRRWGRRRWQRTSCSGRMTRGVWDRWWRCLRRTGWRNRTPFYGGRWWNGARHRDFWRRRWRRRCCCGMRGWPRWFWKAWMWRRCGGWRHLR